MYSLIAYITLFLIFTSLDGKKQPTAPLASSRDRTNTILSSLTHNSFAQGHSGTNTANKIVKLQDMIVQNGGCNANLCFALDGMSKADYERQLEFVQLIAATVAIDERVQMSAYQYGRTLHRISSYTDNINAFMMKLGSSSRYITKGNVFLAPALKQCKRDFAGNPEDANKIVIIADGRANQANRQEAINVAKAFRSPGGNGAICAVHVKKSKHSFLSKVVQNPRFLLQVDEYDRFADILGNIVRNVCEVNLP